MRSFPAVLALTVAVALSNTPASADTVPPDPGLRLVRTVELPAIDGDFDHFGVDVPGNALRLVVFERTPWPRPDILHRERRIHLSDGDPKGYDDRIVRLRLRQAFGRLIRRASDRGVFVLLDRQAPSRLMSAFPAGVVVQRLGLAQAVNATGAFLRTRAFLTPGSPA